MEDRTKAWEKAVEPKAKAVLKRFQQMFQMDLNQIAKEGGKKHINYLLTQAIDMDKNPRDGHYRTLAVVLIFFLNCDIVGLGVKVIDRHVFSAEFLNLSLI